MTAGMRIVRSTGWAALVWLALSGTVSAQVAIPGWATEVGARSPALPNTMETARSMGMGLGARASATSTSAVALNPAGMSIGQLYHIETAVTYDPQPGRFASSTTLMDSYRFEGHYERLELLPLQCSSVLWHGRDGEFQPQDNSRKGL